MLRFFNVEDPEPPERTPSKPSTGCCGSYKVTIVLLLSVLIVVILNSVTVDGSCPSASPGLAVLLVTALWWFTQVVPLTVASLLPMVVAPLLSVVKAAELANRFVFSISFLYISAFFISLAIERWDINSYFACWLISKGGSRMETFIGSFMLAVWLLSMWMSNTAAMFCMLPVIEAFFETLPRDSEDFQAAFLLSVGYSATIGGIATPVGTVTNGLFFEFFNFVWNPEKQSRAEFSFSEFVAGALPLSALLLLTVWLMFCTKFIWRREKKVTFDQALVQNLRAELGPLCYEQWVVLLALCLLILPWIGMDFVRRVSPSLNLGSIGLMMTLPLFLIPSGTLLPICVKKWLDRRGIQYHGCDELRRQSERRQSQKRSSCMSATRTEASVRVKELPKQEPQYILDWDLVRAGFTWELIFVFGGGATIAYTSIESGLLAVIADRMHDVELSEFDFMFGLVIFVSFFTELVSNMTTLPILGVAVASVAVEKGYDPIRFLLAVTFCSSYAFMLPTSGPNMIVRSTNMVSQWLMLRIGFLLNVCAIIITTLYMYFLLPYVMGDYSQLPMPVRKGSGICNITRA